MDGSTWRTRAAQAWRLATADSRLVLDVPGTPTGRPIEDRLIGDFGWTASFRFAEIWHWIDVLERSSLRLRRGLEQGRERSPVRALVDAATGSTFDDLDDAWHTSRHAVQSGLRLVVLTRHYLPIWGPRRADLWAGFGELSGQAYAMVGARRLFERSPHSPFGLFGLPESAHYPRAVAPVRLSAKLDEVERTLRLAGRIFGLAGTALEELRRHKEPARQHARLAEVAALAQRSSTRDS